MKLLSEKKALEKLHRVKSDFQKIVQAGYEHKAKNCITCEIKGACCLDAHFVNVHITRLESVAIRNRLAKLSPEAQAAIYTRVNETISKYDLSSEGDTFSKTYACPLFEKETGCGVHEYGKPLPCIQHACYERKEDLPPDELLTKREGLVEKLNERTYGTKTQWLPLPLAIRQKHDR